MEASCLTSHVVTVENLRSQARNTEKKCVKAAFIQHHQKDLQANETSISDITLLTYS